MGVVEVMYEQVNDLKLLGYCGTISKETGLKHMGIAFSCI